MADPHTDWGVTSDALTDLLAAREMMYALPFRLPTPFIGYYRPADVDAPAAARALMEQEIPAEGTE